MEQGGTVTTRTIVVIGAGAAGLMAAIAAGRAAREARVPCRIVALDGARTLGAKILVAGGGRCNVTHHAVDERAFAGSTRPAIRNVLRRWSVDDTIVFFAGLGVTLKREETGKLFPTTDSARTVLEALLRAARDVGVELVHPWRVERVDPSPLPPARPGEPRRPEEGGSARRSTAETGDGASGSGGRTMFRITSTAGDTLLADRVILATGGLSLPRSGSDGRGHAIARSLGHTITPHVFPALVPLLLPDGDPLRSLGGIASDATVEVRDGRGRRIAAFTDAVLCTHFGLSGPAILDASRWWAEARRDDPRATLVVNWLPRTTAEAFERSLVDATTAAARPSHPPPAFPEASRGAGDGTARTPAQVLRTRLPERLADVLLSMAGLNPRKHLRQLTRDERRAFARTVCALELPIAGDRGWTHAEVTAGGVPLREVHLGTLESRACPGLHLCGEILDVDGRIGGFNFQWAWASGFVAGTAAANDSPQP